MPGTENQIGTGMAQVLPKSPSVLPFIEQLQQQKQLQFQRDKYEQAKKEQDQKELYGLVGDTLNLKDFNPIIHEKVRKAQVELTQQFKADKPAYGDARIAAQNKASELGIISQALNQADAVIAAQKKEWEGDKRINAGNIEMLARKDILDELNKNGKIDPNKNYMIEAAAKYRKHALADNGDYIDLSFQKFELQDGLEGGFKKQNSRKGYDKFDWKVKGEFSPLIWTLNQQNNEAEPTITTNSEPSEIKELGNPPMITEKAYGRIAQKLSNVINLENRVANLYGEDIDPNSELGKKLMRVEAYKYAEELKPKVTSKKIEVADPIRYTSNTTVNVGGQDVNINDIYSRIGESVTRAKANPALRPSTPKLNDAASVQNMAFDESNLIVDFVNKSYPNKGVGDNPFKAGDLFVKEESDGKYHIYDIKENHLGVLPKVGTNIKVQPDVKAKREVVGQGNNTSKPAGNDLSQYDIPKGAKVKYAADGKTPIGYELNGQKYRFQ